MSLGETEVRRPGSSEGRATETFLLACDVRFREPYLSFTLTRLMKLRRFYATSSCASWWCEQRTFLFFEGNQWRWDCVIHMFIIFKILPLILLLLVWDCLKNRIAAPPAIGPPLPELRVGLHFSWSENKGNQKLGKSWVSLSYGKGKKYEMCCSSSQSLQSNGTKGIMNQKSFLSCVTN